MLPEKIVILFTHTAQRWNKRRQELWKREKERINLQHTSWRYSRKWTMINNLNSTGKHVMHINKLIKMSDRYIFSICIYYRCQKFCQRSDWQYNLCEKERESKIKPRLIKLPGSLVLWTSDNKGAEEQRGLCRMDLQQEVFFDKGRRMLFSLRFFLPIGFPVLV